MRTLNKNQQSTRNNSEQSEFWYDYHSRTDEIIVPSKWVNRLEEANAVDNELQVFEFESRKVYSSCCFQYLQEKLDQDLAKHDEEKKKIDRETLYCSAALHKMRQNQFHQRLHDHQMRWVFDF